MCDCVWLSVSVKGYADAASWRGRPDAVERVCQLHAAEHSNDNKQLHLHMHELNHLSLYHHWSLTAHRNAWRQLNNSYYRQQVTALLTETENKHHTREYSEINGQQMLMWSDIY